jgi:hypothetical protein
VRKLTKMRRLELWEERPSVIHLAQLESNRTKVRQETPTWMKLTWKKIIRSLKRKSGLGSFCPPGQKPEITLTVFAPRSGSIFISSVRSQLENPGKSRLFTRPA